MSSGALESFFAEHRLLTELSNSGGAPRFIRSEREQGLSQAFSQSGRAVHLWRPLSPRADELLELPASVRSALRRIQDLEALQTPLLEPLRELSHALEALTRQAGGDSLDVFIQDAQQRVLRGPPEAGLEEDRRHTIIELRVSLKADKRPVHLWRPFCFAHPRELTAARGMLEAACEELAQTLRSWPTPIPCPEGELPVVFPPGAASGSFFHEVCGHPLEGDVVARRGSYLAVRLGERVAEEFVTVTDDPTEAQSSLHYAFDDEGHPARHAALVDRGVVAQPLLSHHTARLLERAPNGHGRRVSFRHPPLPRMAHTGVAAGPHGSLEQLLAPVAHGLFVQHLVPRHMNLLSGDFSFFIIEAREIRDGRLGPLVGPGLLSGNGLQALRDLEAVGGDRRNLFATRGCRKLDHGPLAVSFTQPSLRFRKLRVGPSR